MNPKELLKKYSSNNKDYQIILSHSEKVKEIALRIAKNLKVQTDKDFIINASLLHDIGRFNCPPNKNSLFHGIKGSKIMNKEGFPKIAKVCERHLGAGIDKEQAKRLGLPIKDYLPKTIEEKIITFADNLISGNKEIPFADVIKRFKKEYTKKDVKRLMLLKKEIDDLQKDF